MHVRRTEDRISELQHELETSRDREVSVHEQLAFAVRKAEKATMEKKSFAKMVGFEPNPGTFPPCEK